MKVFTAILLFLFLMSCNSTYQVNSTVTNNDSIRVDSIYGSGIWLKYFRASKTPHGTTINLKVINDSSFLMQWGDSLNLKTYSDTFHLDGHETWIPEFIAENKNYTVMRQRCGNPCWRGYFLPSNDSLKPCVINEYLNFDLDNNLVASIKDSNVIEIKNLKTNLTEDHIINGCTSLFIGYCIDSLSIKNKTLKFKWIPETKINSRNGVFRIEKIKL